MQVFTCKADIDMFDDTQNKILNDDHKHAKRNEKKERHDSTSRNDD